MLFVWCFIIIMKCSSLQPVVGKLIFHSKANFHPPPPPVVRIFDQNFCLHFAFSTLNHFFFAVERVQSRLICLSCDGQTYTRGDYVLYNVGYNLVGMSECYGRNGYFIWPACCDFNFDGFLLCMTF
jgi:hypothetical protein